MKTEDTTTPTTAKPGEEMREMARNYCFLYRTCKNKTFLALR